MVAWDSCLPPWCSILDIVYIFGKEKWRRLLVLACTFSKKHAPMHVADWFREQTSRATRRWSRLNTDGCRYTIHFSIHNISGRTIMLTYFRWENTSTHYWHCWHPSGAVPASFSRSLSPRLWGGESWWVPGTEAPGAQAVLRLCLIWGKSWLTIWRFPEMGVPAYGWFIRENPIKMDDLGVLLF